MPDYTDLSEANGWIPEPSSKSVLLRQTFTSAVEAIARREVMTSNTVSVPRFVATGVDVVAEHAAIPYNTATLDEVVLQSRKFANLFQISFEDSQDAVVDAVGAWKAQWLSNYSIKLDNACLGVTAAANGTTVPFESVYRAAGSGNRVSTAGDLKYEVLSTAFSGVDEGLYGGNSVVIAHPAFKSQIRNMKDTAGVRVAQDSLLNAEVPTLWGSPVVFSNGARTNATASDAPTGNPLLIVANRQHLILGVRSGPESQVSDTVNFVTDHIDVKMRARRAFALATPAAVRIVELTASA